jgi:putative FmdB family regulatory protein
MPKYVYRCDECEDVFEIRHSMGETLEKCISCEAENCLVRIPQMQFRKKPARSQNKKETGSLVREYIEENRKILKEEKTNAKNQEWKP